MKTAIAVLRAVAIGAGTLAVIAVIVAFFQGVIGYLAAGG